MIKKPMPGIATIEYRENYLSHLTKIEPIPPKLHIPNGLMMGNKKLGQSGRFYKSIFVWDLPAVTTCPGASEECMEICYNADPRDDIFPVEDWAINWWWVENQQWKLKNKIKFQIDKAAKPCTVRIHSSGDFYSEDYIQFWIEIVKYSPPIQFWAYTKSWWIPELLPALQELHDLENVQLFASWDRSMPEPPKGWRLAVVRKHDEEAEDFGIPKQNMFQCPEQTGKVPNCASCGLCMRNSKKGVFFYLH